MPHMDRDELKAMLASQYMDANAADSASDLADQRSRALDYYNGDMTADMPAADGRSKAVSTDVADTVEGLMPSLIEIFTSNDEVVQFEPVGPEDIQAAEQETDYVNHVFMQQNAGFRQSGALGARLAHNQQAVGSIPTSATKFAG